MAHDEWYQVNVYPNTKRGFFTVAVMKCKGFNLPCFHIRNHKCKKNANFKKSHVVSAFHGLPIEDSMSVMQMLEECLEVLRSQQRIAEDDHGDWHFTEE